VLALEKFRPDLGHAWSGGIKKSGLQGMRKKKAEKACNRALGLTDKFLRDSGFEQQQGKTLEPLWAAGRDTGTIMGSSQHDKTTGSAKGRVWTGALWSWAALHLKGTPEGESQGTRNGQAAAGLGGPSHPRKGIKGDSENEESSHRGRNRMGIAQEGWETSSKRDASGSCWAASHQHNKKGQQKKKIMIIFQTSPLWNETLYKKEKKFM
jgi:hypothetical protein